jgi:hypothetical protein
VPEDRLSVGEAGAHVIGPPGPFEVVTNQNVRALLAVAADEITEVVVPRESLAVALNYLHHLATTMANTVGIDQQLRDALSVLDEEMRK